MSNDGHWSRMKYSISKYLWDARRAVFLRKLNFYRELSPLERIFSTKDCSLLSFGSMVGIGLHLLLQACIETYGTLMIFSVAISAVGTLITGMVYAELASLAPSTGTVYHYSYYAIGELVGFLVGWNMIFAYSFSCAFSLRFLGKFVDRNLFGNFFRCEVSLAILGDVEGIKVDVIRFVKNLTFPGIVLSLVLAGLNSITMNVSKTINNWVVIITIIFTYFCFLMYSIFIDFGAFSRVLPSGVRQLDFFICASSHMAYCFSGYEVITCMGEEAINPSKTIPKSLLISISSGIVTYLLMVILHILVWSTKSEGYLSPVSNQLFELGLWPLNHAALIAALTGMWSSAYASMFLVIRVTYAMSRDGLISKLFSRVSVQTKTPIFPAFFWGLVIGVLAMTFEVDTLGTIGETGIAFSKVVAVICLLLTRYRCENRIDYLKLEEPRWFLINYPDSQVTPTRISETVAELLILNIILGVSSLILLFRCAAMFDKTSPVIRAGGLLLILIIIFLIVCLYRQPQNDRMELYYKVRGVPTIPLLVICNDLYTTSSIEASPQLVISAWILIGVLFYFCYSVTHSVENRHVHADGRRWSSMRDSTQINTPSIYDDDNSKPNSSTEIHREVKDEQNY